MGSLVLVEGVLLPKGLLADLAGEGPFPSVQGVVLLEVEASEESLVADVAREGLVSGV